jgi:hypothetical protein
VGKRSRTALSCGALVAVLLLGGSLAGAAAKPSAKHGAGAIGNAPTTSNVTWHFEGQHNGVERIEFHTKLCAVLDHRLRETFTLTDGTTWSFQAHYCGTIDAHGIWTGVGTFVITTTNATLSGTFTDSAQLPTLGVPYELDVNSGSGAFAGASGSCILDDHVSSLAPGEQYQEGDFVCDLTSGSTHTIRGPALGIHPRAPLRHGQ